MTIFLLRTHKTQKTAGLRCDDHFFSLEITLEIAENIESAAQ